MILLDFPFYRLALMIAGYEFPQKFVLYSWHEKQKVDDWKVQNCFSLICSVGWAKMSLALVMSSEGGSLLCISNCFCFWLQILMMEGLWSGDRGRREGYMEETQQVSYQENWCCLCLFPSSLVPFICFVYQNKIINLMSLNTLFIGKTLELFGCFHLLRVRVS